MRAIMILAILAVLPAAGADPVGVNPTGDARGDTIAVSGTGNATSDGFAASGTGQAHSTCRRFGTIPCATVTILGNTSGSNTTIEAGRPRACVFPGISFPVCLVDDGTRQTSAIGISREGSAVGWFAALGMGGTADGGYAAIGKGDARATWVAVSLDGEADAFIAIEGRALLP